MSWSTPSSQPNRFIPPPFTLVTVVAILWLAQYIRLLTTLEKGNHRDIFTLFLHGKRRPLLYFETVTT